MTTPAGPGPRHDRVLIVGAAGALGTAIARAHAADGARVTLVDLRAPTDLTAELPGTGHRADALDVTDRGAVLDHLAAAAADDPPSAVVYAAGTNTSGPIAALDPAAYDRVMDVNVRGAFHVAQGVARALLPVVDELRLVLLASTAGQRGEAGGTVYCASKFALIGLMQSLAAEFAPAGARVNAVAPGNVDSPMLRQLAVELAARGDGDVDGVLHALAQEAVLGRLIDPVEVARACTWLTSDASAGVTGTTINVDGGMLTA
ncbi:MAG: SDR family oxidoreductase [Nitriliruptoraceae bacterium]|nr:SDR family oxidoreductase [Nitriliruptoraceae bacterium]